MGLSAFVKSLYLANVGTGNQRMVEIPAAAAGFNLVSDGAAAANAYMASYTTIVAAATITDPSWIVGIVLGIPVVEAFRCDIKLATGAAGAEVDIFTIQAGTNVFPPVEWANPVIMFGGNGVKVIGSPRVSFNIRKTTAASAAGFNACHLLVKTSVGV